MRDPASFKLSLQKINIWYISLPFHLLSEHLNHHTTIQENVPLSPRLSLRHCQIRSLGQIDTKPCFIQALSNVYSKSTFGIYPSLFISSVSTLTTTLQFKRMYL
eukprot:TRINITY_DN1297_c2_g1_i11.p1 TRINITY_DN1297_c2_g1~~TRINITY_DN1297_c2_g1_i11.p1  ORF type:complete len:104 (+),score=4.51 TRINITY_DN1297_c2_g1_i11:319-630(+)